MKTSWHIDRKISTGTAIAVFCHIIVGVWYTSKIDSRIGTLEDATKDNSTVIERLVRVETRLDGLAESVNRIDLGVAKIAERRP